jgi:ankyrin repeat protein
MVRKVVFLCVSSVVLAASSDQIRSGAAKAVALIQTSQSAWKQDCYSCHHHSLPPLAFRTAREHGIPVNEDAAHASAVQGFSSFSNLDRAVQFTHVIEAATSDGALMVGGEAAGMRPNLATAVYARIIAEHQKPDGHWTTLDQRPPSSYSSITATAIAIRAIQLFGHPSLAADTRARVSRARDWLASQTPRDNEERASQLLALKWGGANAAAIDTAGKSLLRVQQSDGGWNFRDGLGSDAYSTAHTLVALHEAAGLAISDARWQRGIQFLLSTQAADGSWHVETRLHPPAPLSPPYFESGYPYGHDQFISMLAASWAVQALAAALPSTRTQDLPALREAAPSNVDPWVETMLFGSAAEVRALLDKGLDVNSSTKAGTTALMLVQPDVEKTRLLLDRGAKINARAKTKYSALMVAAQYWQSAPAMNLLLDRGAEVNLPKGAGTPLFNASPLMLATMAGNAAILPRLVKAGANPSSPMLLLGTASMTPLLAAVSWGDADSVRTLLDQGASVELADDDGITPLEWAALGNQTAVARLLIEHKADVNHVDKKGMTALLYAASVEFGDASMVDLLLKSGANPKARTKEGWTASDLARKYRLNLLFKPLSIGP